jgi:hypothetical protein
MMIVLTCHIYAKTTRSEYLFRTGDHAGNSAAIQPQGQVMRMANHAQITAAVGGIMPQLTFGALTA